MPSITAAFAEALDTVNRPSSFFVAGTQQILAPGLAVDGVAPIALPLLPVQAEALIEAAERAPFGRGKDTITDVTVRRTWQIAADRVAITGRHWADTLAAIVTRVAEGLGVAGSVEAELYKLLVYDQGSFFVPHRDTEKTRGMFATLVLALPSVSEGGELIVRHGDREARIDLRCEEPSDIAFAAFYADCVHEVLPVTAGYRLVLVYNLLRHGAGQLPMPPDYAGEQDALTTLLRQWVASPRPRVVVKDDADADDDEEEEEDADDDADDDEEEDDDADDDADPEKLIYPLEHAYTPAELGFQALKGADAGIAPVVVAAAERAGCDVHLALVTIEESGIAEYTGGYSRSRRGRYHDDDEDDDAFEVVEVADSHAVASLWCRPDGKTSPLTEIPVEENEFSPPITFEDLEPDEQHFHEATGNEGASFERTYRRAALILWPRDRLLAVINQAGLRVTLPFLEDLATRLAATADPALRDQARQLSREMAATWPQGRYYPGHEAGPGNTGRFLDLLVRLQDQAGLDSFLTALVGRQGFGGGDGPAVADALHALGADRAADLATRLVESAAATALASCGTMLVRLSAHGAAAAAGAARALVAALPGDPMHAATGSPWQRGPGIRPEFIGDLFTALGRIDATLAAVTADHVLEWPARYHFDIVLIPAVRLLLDAPETNGQAVVQRLRAACLAHLKARIALPLTPPADWRRDNRVGCDCKDCQGLAAFLEDATQPVWVFQAAADRRSHVESTVRNAVCDVDMATEKRGSPHRLICTKNQASYRRRCEQRANDLAEHARLIA